MKHALDYSPTIDEVKRYFSKLPALTTVHLELIFLSINYLEIIAFIKYNGIFFIL